MKSHLTLMMFAALALLSTMMVATLYQQQTNAQTVRSIQNQTNGHSQSLICINGVCTNGTCTNDSCETSIRCINGRCETTTSSGTNQFP
ncbi:MAG: hypothetical protein K0S67_1743 [Nitrososphaeraceae archaeon]|nr:hypothetical protein [Nitrososphaeraceae archaeon]MDF2768412.1 hypothetical protein [Nitrososphaeraceae archaeon]